ncbi:hypothetical protein AXF42_Ash015354 [Apostasia shenzhenica]|uniref:Anaphase-promoting complex subunit CDC26 n=1 Tax=Apostasia shenzhenica TaxID=1088818 RepID=A0A2I0ALY7_9ASPA|nr:hypothetical protein AXF42_Ash015354 [Apostasia shenzhenica]
MLRRKPSVIELKVDDKEEIEEALRLRSRSTLNPSTSNPNPNPSSSSSSLLQHFLEPLDPAAKAHRIGLLPPTKP